MPKWIIKNNPEYYFCTEKKLHNLITKRVIKKRVKGYSVGYTINGKFVTTKTIKPLLLKYTVKQEYTESTFLLNLE